MPDVIIKQPNQTPGYVKLLVLKDLRLENGVFYTKDHEIEVFYHEAVTLMNLFPDYFKVVE